jgi:hypothetical protein
MRKLLAVAMALAVLPVSVQAQRGNEPLRDPVTVELTTKASAAQVRKAVKLAVLNRRWEISNEKGNSFDATYTRESKRASLTAKINVTHSANKVTIKYVSSDGMSYNASNRSINRNYNAWVGNLEKDIPIYVEREVIASQ